MCGVIGKSITSHIKSHNISKSEYEKKFGPTICQSSKKRYSETQNYDWIKREKEKGNDLKEWREKLGKKTSEGIMNSESARAARRANLTRLNKTKEFREKSSKTAKQTSARKEILEKRSRQLKEWRENNPEEFYNKCTSVMINSWKSKPETQLFEILNKKYSFFKRNQQLRRVNKFKTTKSGKRQIDIMSLENKIIVEFDGVHHFNNIHGVEVLKKNIKKDNELNFVMVAEGWTVIRVAHDQYSYNSGGVFSEDSIKRIFNLIDNKERGLFLIGASYTCNNKD